MGSDSYDKTASKNRDLHNGRNYEGHFLVGHTVSSDLENLRFGNGLKKYCVAYKKEKVYVFHPKNLNVKL